MISRVVFSSTFAGIYRKQQIRIGFVNLFDYNHKTSAQKGV